MKVDSCLCPCFPFSDSFSFVSHRPPTLKGLPRCELMLPLIFPLPRHADGVRGGGGLGQEEDGRLVTRRWAGSASPAPPRVRLTSWFQLPFFFSPLLIPIVEKLPSAGEITCATLWSQIFLISGYCGISLSESN